MSTTHTRNVPKRLVNAGAQMYKHQIAGFSLLIPASMNSYDGLFVGRHLTLGSVSLILNHSKRTIHGKVPPSWLVDLNADSAVTHEEIEQ